MVMNMTEFHRLMLWLVGMVCMTIMVGVFLVTRSEPLLLCSFEIPEGMVPAEGMDTVPVLQSCGKGGKLSNMDWPRP